MEQKPNLAIDINSKNSVDLLDLTAPTPYNTPIPSAPIHSFNFSKTSKMENAPVPNADLVQMIQQKLGTVIGKSSGYIESLPPSVHRRINGLKFYQAKHSELEAEFHKEILALEKKYNTLYQPLYEKRTSIVNGSYEPTEQEVEEGSKIDEDQVDQVKSSIAEVNEDENLKGIPEFWLTCMKNHVAIADEITSRDEEALKHLKNIELIYLEDKPGFKLEFHFEENPFFEEKVLTKTYYYQHNPGMGDLVFEKAEGCPITWKKDHDLTVKVESKKQRQKGKDTTRIVKKTVPADTFFSFFSPIQLPENEEELEDSDLESRLQADYELGEEIKDKLIPHAVDWFTGKALTYEGYDEDDFDDNAFDDSEDEEESLDEDWEDDEDNQ